VTGFGENPTLSTTILSPATSDETGTELPFPPPPDSWTTLVASESPADWPALLLAITFTRMRLPTSAARTTYVFPVAPIPGHDVSVELQLCHL